MAILVTVSVWYQILQIKYVHAQCSKYTAETSKIYSRLNPRPSSGVDRSVPSEPGVAVPSRSSDIGASELSSLTTGGKSGGEIDTLAGELESALCCGVWPLRYARSSTPTLGENRVDKWFVGVDEVSWWLLLLVSILRHLEGGAKAEGKPLTSGVADVPSGRKAPDPKGTLGSRAGCKNWGWRWCSKWAGKPG